MKQSQNNLRIKKILTVGRPLLAIIIGCILGYATVFFHPYIDGIRLLVSQNIDIQMVAGLFKCIGFGMTGIILIITILRDVVKNTSILFSLFGLAYLGSLGYFTLAILEIITQLT